MVSYGDVVINFLAIYILIFGPTYLCYEFDSKLVGILFKILHQSFQDKSDVSVENGTEWENSVTNITETCPTPNLTLNMSQMPIGMNLDFTQYCSMKKSYPFIMFTIMWLKLFLIYRGFNGCDFLKLNIRIFQTEL